MTQAPKPTPKPPLNEQITEILLKIFMTGGVAGGLGGAFWSVLKNNDLQQALASLLLGAATAYAAKFLEEVHLGNLRRSQQAGKKLSEGIDWVTEQAIAAASRFEDKYLLCQAADCQSLRSEGMAQREGIFVPLLKEVFVPLALDFSATAPGFRALAQKLTADGLEDSSLTIWDFLAKAEESANFRQLVILAWGGYGKTTLLKHIAFRYGTKQPVKGPKRVPILLVLRQYRDLLSQAKPPSLPELIAQHHLPNLPNGETLQPTAIWAKTCLSKGRAVVMLDGFDEVPKEQRPAVARWINQQVKDYSRSIFILTSRPKAYREQEAGSRLNLATPLWVQDFDAEQRQRFVTQWYRCQERYANVGRDTPDVRKVADDAAQDLLDQIDARQELKDLAKNPLLLNLIVTFHRRFPGAELPKHRAQLYREICTLQLRERPQARRLETVLPQCEPQPILQQLALAMMQQRQERIEKAALLEQLDQWLLQADEDIDPVAFLTDIVQIGELLVQQEDEYEFAHLSFQEYLAATHLVQTKQEAKLYPHLQDDWWKATILLYAGQTNPTTLMRQAMEQGSTDLAYACLQETSKRVDNKLTIELADLQTVAEQVTDARYAQLEAYLKAGEWKQADGETYRLMITAVGKEEGQGFSLDDLRNFPCEELLAIDRVWVKHSQGKFGFSVQKKIYVETGNPLDGQFYSQTFDKFYDAVGWSSIRYTFDSPKGHLPFGFAAERRGVAAAGVGISSLASRLVNCSS